MTAVLQEILQYIAKSPDVWVVSQFDYGGLHKSGA
jgi:hypothetical protein